MLHSLLDSSALGVGSAELGAAVESGHDAAVRCKFAIVHLTRGLSCGILLRLLRGRVLLDATRVDDRNPWLIPAAVLGGCMLLGLVLGGWLLGMEIKETRLSDRYVTVKGLVERTVKSDSAVWPVTFKETGNDLQQVYAKSEEDRAAVLKFFAAQRITPQEISVGQIQVTDKQANEYGGNNKGGPRYIVQRTVKVSSGDG